MLSANTEKSEADTRSCGVTSGKIASQEADENLSRKILPLRKTRVVEGVCEVERQIEGQKKRKSSYRNEYAKKASE